jgi:hypothetical protein
MEGIELTTAVVNQPCSSLSRPLNTETENEVMGHNLAPADGGPAAWKLLLAAFVFEALLWGKPLSKLTINTMS